MVRSNHGYSIDLKLTFKIKDILILKVKSLTFDKLQTF